MPVEQLPDREGMSEVMNSWPGSLPATFQPRLVDQPGKCGMHRVLVHSGASDRDEQCQGHGLGEVPVDALGVVLKRSYRRLVHRHQPPTAFGVTHPQYLTAAVDVVTVEGEPLPETR